MLLELVESQREGIGQRRSAAFFRAVADGTRRMAALFQSGSFTAVWNCNGLPHVCITTFESRENVAAHET